jgi:hypothetical protein
MTERIAEALPRPRARIIGVVYLLYFLTPSVVDFSFFHSQDCTLSSFAMFSRRGLCVENGR